MKQNFTNQTHFLGILLSEDLEEEIEGAREYMRANFACKSGQKTPLHVTLVPPFHLSEEFSTSDIIAALENITSQSSSLSFTAKVTGYDAFADRTLFAKVEKNPQWEVLRDKVLKELLSACPHCTKKDTRPFTPHITVANRDIPLGATTIALKTLNELGLSTAFSVNNIAIFERKNGLWQANYIIEIA